VFDILKEKNRLREICLPHQHLHHVLYTLVTVTYVLMLHTYLFLYCFVTNFVSDRFVETYGFDEYTRVNHMKTLNGMLQAGPPSLHYYCAVVLHSCIVLPPVSHSTNHQYHCCQLIDNRAVFRIFIALLRFSFDSPSYNKWYDIFRQVAAVAENHAIQGMKNSLS